MAWAQVRPAYEGGKQLVDGGMASLEHFTGIGCLVVIEDDSAGTMVWRFGATFHSKRH